VVLVHVLLLYTVYIGSCICEHFKDMEQEESIPIASVTSEQEYKRVLDSNSYPIILQSAVFNCSAYDQQHTWYIYQCIKGTDLNVVFLDTTTLDI
jgi:hypothetical protein